ncbi:TonB-dependent siderophore receptor [Carnimonas bestiolae]|uniref:TonB-dependent siderophore receptor n=1 Tax=Carnimonas bestiolae TaxID=3402172 RepID=UPI003EDB9FC4
MKSVSITLMVLSSGALGSVANSALAQQAPVSSLDTVTVQGARSADDDDSYHAGQSSIADKTPTPYLEQTQTTNTVTARQLSDFAPQNIEQATGYIPGVAIGNNFGGAQEGLIRRGFSGGTNDGGVLLDGVKSPIGLNFLPAATDHIEVLKGPASLLYGMQEPGGVINMISKKPQYQWSSTIGTQASSHGGGTSYLDITGPLGKGWAFRLIGQKKNENYWRNFGKTKQDFIQPELSYQDAHLSFDASYQYLDDENPIDRGSMYYQGHYLGSHKKRLDEPFSKSSSHRHTVNTTTEYRFNDNNRLRLTAAWNQDNYSDQQVDSRSYFPDQHALTRRYRSQDSAQRTHWYAALDYISQQQLWGMRHDLVVGADYEKYKNRTGKFYQGKDQQVPGDSEGPLFDPYHPVYGNLERTRVERVGNEYEREDIEGASAYVKDSIHLTDRLIFAPGVRFQYFEVKNGANHPYEQYTDEHDGRVLPFVGFVYKVTNDVSLYADYSESFRPNEMSGSDPLESSYKPQTGRQYEGGVKYDNGTWSSNVALYHITKKNVPYSVLDEAGDPAQRLAGKVESSGIEASVTGRVTDNLSILASYAYTDTDNKEGENKGNRQPNVPYNAAGLFATYQLPHPVAGGNLRFGAGGRYVGKRAGDAANSFSIPSYETADAFISWNTTQLLGKETSFQINATNLTNNEYFVSSGENTKRLTWGEGRTFRFTGKVSF